MRYFARLVGALAMAGLLSQASGCVAGAAGNDANVSPDSVAANGATSANGGNIEQIRDERAHDAFTPDFAIGPGDVLDISVPDVPEINSRVERVSAQNTIDLPVAGDVRVGGLTEDQAREAIRNALSKLVKDPQVNLFVKEYTSRQVAVVGMVNKPGLFSLNSRSDTVLDLIGKAGGMTERASNVVILIPAPASNGGRISASMLAALNDSQTANSQSATSDKQLAAQSPASAEGPQKAFTPDQNGFSKASYSTVPKGADSVSIDLISLTRGSRDDIPVRPGDVIIVPASGSVLVQGWVRTPGAYPITPGLTAYGAVTAAGGAMFSSTARLLRTDHSGQRVEMRLDLAKVEHGEEPDIAVQSGDVVLVNKSAAGAVPYGMYEIFEHFGSGMSIGVPLF